MDLDTLLLPVSQAEPCGIALLHESEYDDIGSARLEDDPSLPRGVWTSELKKANWKEVVHLCEAALTKRSKDLQVAAWLGEAWIAQEGIQGGLRAMRLMSGLCQRYWEDVHPRPREADFDFRTAPLNWADEYWSRAILMRIVLVAGGGPDGRSYTLAQWNEALRVEADAVKNKGARKAAEAAGTPTYAAIMANLAGMALASVNATLGEVRAWRDELAAFNALIEPLLPPPGARMGKLENRLAALDDVLQRCLEQHPAYVAPQPEPAPPEVAVAPGAAPAEPALALSGRNDAYQQLEQIAAYLAKIEPHSPVPSLIRRAVEWGHMPFDQLMDELMHNNAELHKVLWRAPRS